MKTTLAIKTIDDKSLWNEACGNNLLQSWEWGEFQKEIGHKTWRIGLFEISHDGNDEVADLKAIALGQLIKTKLRTHIYISNGPVFAEGESLVHTKSYFSPISGYFKALALREKANFLRFDPLFDKTSENEALMKELGFVKAGMHIQAECTLLLDLSKSEEDLLKEMKKDTRYEIKKSEKDGITVEVSEKVEDFDRFWILFEQTSKRQKFVPNKKEYYDLQFQTFLASKKAKLFFAKSSDGKDLATALIISQGNKAVYLHAASLDSKVEDLHYAPKLLLWHAVLDAQKAGLKLFDFYGIAKTDSPKDPWHGFTHFKKGFGGVRKEVIAAYDLPITPVYWFIKFIETTRGIWTYPYYKVKGLFSKNQ